MIEDIISRITNYFNVYRNQRIEIELNFGKFDVSTNSFDTKLIKPEEFQRLEKQVQFKLNPLNPTIHETSTEHYFWRKYEIVQDQKIVAYCHRYLDTCNITSTSTHDVQIVAKITDPSNIYKVPNLIDYHEEYSKVAKTYEINGSKIEFAVIDDYNTITIILQ